jgi:hypothetical protein
VLMIIATPFEGPQSTPFHQFRPPDPSCRGGTGTAVERA